MIPTMSAKGIPVYTLAEDAKIRRFYPRHARSHVLRALPQRSWQSIIYRAQYLKVIREQEAKQLESIRVDKALISRLTSHDRAYVAGILDGEGCICFNKSTWHISPGSPNPAFHLRIRLATTSEQLRQWLLHKFPGRLYQRKMIPVNKQGVKSRRVCYEMIVSGTNLSRVFLKALLPYLVIKKEQAELMLRGYLHLSQAERLALWQRMRDLKRTS